MSLRISTIENLLGVNAQAADTRPAPARSIEAGLPVSALDRLAEAVAPKDAMFKFRLLPKATLERRRRSTKRFTIEEGSRLARISKVYAIALDIYHDPEKVRDFLGRPHMMLDNKPEEKEETRSESLHPHPALRAASIRFAAQSPSARVRFRTRRRG